MNSSSMYKNTVKILCLIVVLTLSLGTLCACSSKGVYRIDKISWVSNENINIETTYTYNEYDKPETITVNYPYNYGESYIDSFTYNKRGILKTLTRSYDSGAVQNFTADKITNHKYILYDNDKKEFLTIIFDYSGFIVSYRYANGYITEYGFSYEADGKPISMKQLDVTPSGSNQTLDFVARFTDASTYRLYRTGENSNENEYYEVKFQKIEVKG